MIYFAASEGGRMRWEAGSVVYQQFVTPWRAELLNETWCANTRARHKAARLGSEWALRRAGLIYIPTPCTTTTLISKLITQLEGTLCCEEHLEAKPLKSCTKQLITHHLWHQVIYKWSHWQWNTEYKNKRTLPITCGVWVFLVRRDWSLSIKMQQYQNKTTQQHKPNPTVEVARSCLNREKIHSFL